MLSHLLPILSLIFFFIVLRLWLWNVVLPVAKSSNTTIMRWRIIGHFYNVGAIYKMLRRLAEEDHLNRQKYRGMMTVFILLHVLTFAALVWTIGNLVYMEKHFH